jgi:hypothetical protein
MVLQSRSRPTLENEGLSMKGQAQCYSLIKDHGPPIS